MKKITVREMKWINKGNYKKIGFDRIEAKGKDSFLYAISDEDFSFSSNHILNDNNYSLFISISNITYLRLDLNKDFRQTTAIKGYEVVNYYSNLSKEIKDSFTLTIKRTKDNFIILINDIIISSTTLPAAKDAISFGFLFNNNNFVKIDNIRYNN